MQQCRRFTLIELVVVCVIMMLAIIGPISTLP